MTRQVVTGNSELMRQLNRSLVLDLIRRQGPISKADVRRITGLNFTTVTNAVNDLELRVQKYFVEGAARRRTATAKIEPGNGAAKPFDKSLISFQ